MQKKENSFKQFFVFSKIWCKHLVQGGRGKNYYSVPANRKIFKYLGYLDAGFQMFVCRFKMTVEDDSWNQLENNILIFLPSLIALTDPYPLIVKLEIQPIGQQQNPWSSNCFKIIEK